MMSFNNNSQINKLTILNKYRERNIEYIKELT